MKQLHSPGILEWSSLPPEIRIAILETIVDLRLPCWSALASVSKEWQSVIGARNMAKLKLRRRSCFDGFKTIIEQRHLVKHIYLSIELPSYPCHLCSGTGPPRHEDYDHIIGQAIDRVTSILSTWETEGPLTLDLNATSPSDTKYWAKNFRFDDDHDADAPIPETGWHDPTHGWQVGVQTESPSFFELQQLFMPVVLGADHLPAVDLPPITAVTCLMIRRQFRRFLVRRSLDGLLGRLDRLTDMIYEPWSLLYTQVSPRHLIDAYFKPQSPGDERYARVVCTPLPLTLKRLIVFRDDNEFLKAANFQQHPVVQQYSRARQRLRDRGYRLVDNDNENSRGLALISLRLEELSASFVVEAQDFFKACPKDWTWGHLHSLALTTRILDIEQFGQNDSNDLLLAMSTLALRMPLLRTFVLWHGRNDNASAFIYTRSEKCAYVVWRGNRRLDFSPEVLEAWSNVAKFHSSELIRVRHDAIIERIRCHGDAIHYLDLPCQVIEPTSLWQIRMEGPASRGARP